MMQRRKGHTIKMQSVRDMNLRHSYISDDQVKGFEIVNDADIFCEAC